jgi:hypothetical protein
MKKQNKTGLAKNLSILYTALILTTEGGIGNAIAAGNTGQKGEAVRGVVGDGGVFPISAVFDKCKQASNSLNTARTNFTRACIQSTTNKNCPSAPSKLNFWI